MPRRKAKGVSSSGNKSPTAASASASAGTKRKAVDDTASVEDSKTEGKSVQKKPTKWKKGKWFIENKSTAPVRSFKSQKFIDGKLTNPKYKKQWKNHKQIVSGEHYDALPAQQVTFSNIEAGASRYPAKKYCDLTGLKARYQDPQTKLLYHSASQFVAIRTMPEDVAAQYLELRNLAGH